MKRAVFLDRDGVINQMIFRMGKMRAPYLLSEFKFFDGVDGAIKEFKKKDYLVIVVTNQPDVARGWVSLDQVQAVNHFVSSQLHVDEIMTCFHTDKDDCECRKPRPGMLLEAAKKWDIDLSKSFMVGDRLSDVDAGQRAGCKSILVGVPESEDPTILPEFVCRDLLEASRWILT